MRDAMGVKESCGPWEGYQSSFISQFTRANIPSVDACQYRSKLPQNHRLKLPHLNDERADETQDVHEFEVTSFA